MIDVALDTRQTSHMSVGMCAYVRELALRLPRVAPDIALRRFGTGDNFDWGEHVAMPTWILANKPRVVHIPTPYVPFWVPAPLIATVHDLIELRYAEFAKPSVAPYYRMVIAPVLRRARCVIVMSERTGADARRYLGIEAERLRVIPLGIDESFLAADVGVPRDPPYILYAGNHRPHKNLATLFAAWLRFPLGEAPDLHLTGIDDLDATVRPARRDAKLVFLGDLSTSALIEAYRGALAYVQPAIIEGFGLPQLEAASLGVPVVASRESVLDTLAAHTLTFEARDVESLAAHLLAIVRDPATARERSHSAREIARTLTWDRCAVATAEVYREAVA